MSNMVVKDVRTQKPAQNDFHTFKIVKLVDGSADKDETVKFAESKAADKQEAARIKAKLRLQKGNVDDMGTLDEEPEWEELPEKG